MKWLPMKQKYQMDGVGTTLYAAFTVDMVDTVDMVYTVSMVDTVEMVYTVEMVDTVDMVYTMTWLTLLT